MERGYRDVSRASLAGADYDDYGSYDRSGRGVGGYLDRDPPLRESYRGGSSSGYRSSSSSYDREIMESLLQQRALQHQLSLRESQLALANSLLQQQQQQQRFLNKRRMEGPRGGGDFREDFKRPRLMDNRSRPRNRSTGRDLDAGGRARGTRGGSGGRRIQSSPRGRGQGSADRYRGSRESYDPERPTGDNDAENRWRCRLCKEDCKDEEEFKKHRVTSQHKENVAAARANKDPGKKGFCHVCDVPLEVSFLHHQRLTFHKKRKVQVMKGCGWCKVTSFKNFSEVLAHRTTEKHVKNQALYGREKDDKSKGAGKSRREPIKVELPPELAKFDPKAAVGQSCISAVTGWFCKLCNKFYNNEAAAKETHCMTEFHFNNYKKFMYTKLKAKAEAERDAKEKAEEEERKKKEAEAAAEKEGGGEKAENADADGAGATAEQLQADDQEPTDTAEGGEAEEAEEEMDVEENRAAEEEEEGGAGEEGGEEYGEEGGEEYEEGSWAVPEADPHEGEEEGAGAEGGAGQEAAEELGEGAEVENPEGNGLEDEAMVTEESIEGEGGEAAEEDEEEVEQRKATRSTVSSPGRGRGRGAGSNRARRGRRVAK